MTPLRNWTRSNLARMTAVLLLLGAYAVAKPPAVSHANKSSLAEQFQFRRYIMPTIPGQATASVRNVNPSLDRIKSWISSVGAGVALGDLDRNGLPDDACLIDTRTNTARVAPVPGSIQRYSPFDLQPAPLAYDETMAPMGCLMNDLNEDGQADLLVYYWGRSPIAFIRTAADGLPRNGAYTPQEVTTPRERWFSNAATLADLDGDGHLDLVIGNYFPDSSRILDPKAETAEQMQHSMSRAFNGGGPRLLRWVSANTGPQGAVRYEPVREAIPVEARHGWTLGAGAADVDGDLLPELYLANDFGPDRFLQNLSRPGEIRFGLLEGKASFASISSNVIGRDSFKGMGIDFGDLNGDGRYDMVVSNIANPFALLESHFAWINTGGPVATDKPAPFVNRAEALGVARSGWGWDIKMGDFNNDSTPEIVQATGFVRGKVNRWADLQELATGNDELLSNPALWPKFHPGDDLSGRNHNPFFVRGNDGRYVDVAPELGLAEPQVSRGIAIADVDGDGLLDFAVANQWGDSSFYRNTCANCGRFLHLTPLLPVGTATDVAVYPGVAPVEGRPAIGTTATVLLPDGRRLVAQVDGGNGHSGKRSPELHFGLGDLPADAELRVELQWRDARGQIQQRTLTLKPGRYTVRLR